jgi:hypothetical protein
LSGVSPHGLNQQALEFESKDPPAHGRIVLEGPGPSELDLLLGDVSAHNPIRPRAGAASEALIGGGRRPCQNVTLPSPPSRTVISCVTILPSISTDMLYRPSASFN